MNAEKGAVNPFVPALSEESSETSWGSWGSIPPRSGDLPRPELRGTGLLGGGHREGGWGSKDNLTRREEAAQQPTQWPEGRRPKSGVAALAAPLAPQPSWAHSPAPKVLRGLRPLRSPRSRGCAWLRALRRAVPSAATRLIAVGLGLQEAVREGKKPKRQEEKIHKYLLSAACVSGILISFNLPYTPSRSVSLTHCSDEETKA